MSQVVRQLIPGGWADTVKENPSNSSVYISFLNFRVFLMCWFAGSTSAEAVRYPFFN